jgi:tartrate dehydratase beta subunit/fumarate hydratase class I family protein
MANSDIPRGFLPIGSTSSSDYNGKTSAYAIAAADTTIYGRGDLVKRTGEMVTIDGQTYPVVARAAAGDVRLEGAIVGFDIDIDSLSTFRSAGAKSAPRVCFLPADPYVEYEAQADGDIVDASAGLNAAIIVGNADTVTGQSVMEIDSGTTTAPATTATLALRLVRRSRSISNESGANAVWVVRINQHASRDTLGV